MKRIPEHATAVAALMGIDRADGVAERINSADPSERQSILDGAGLELEETLSGIGECCLAEEGWKKTDVDQFTGVVRRAFNQRISQRIMPASGHA